MNASQAFRSHLMQQFAATARHQARTPIALIGWIPPEEHDETTAQKTNKKQERSSSSNARRSISSIATTATPLSRPPSPSSSSHHRRPFGVPHQLPFNKRDATHSLLSRRFSSASIDPEPPAPRAASSCEDAQDWELTDAFQNLLMTRRTSGKFAVPSSLALQPSHWKDALERAVRCGRSAPNHKRTEPFAFKRMISPSLSTERLADIAYEVSLREQREKKNGHVTDDLLRAAAARKRDKWSQIPAFLVTLCASSTVQDSSETNDPYTVLPYIAPQSERELEDYAATCAAVQNILLSLHSEHLATKWATGPVIRTPAFRQLVEACPTDRVVALIMVGMSDNNNNNSSSSKLRQRRQRRVLHGDVLVDL